ncbi:unnamed protein product, partial [Linum tenue]
RTSYPEANLSRTAAAAHCRGSALSSTTLLFSSLFLSSSPDISPLILQFFSPKHCPRKSCFKPRRRASKPLFSLIPFLTLRSAVSRTPGKLTATLATADFYVRFKGSSKPSRNCGSGFDGEEEAGSVIPTKPHSPLQIPVPSLYTHSRKGFYSKLG